MMVLIVSRSQLRIIEPRLQIHLLQLQAYSVKSRNLGFFQVERVQVETTSLSHRQFYVTVQIQHVHVNSVNYDWVALLVLKRNLKLCYTHRYTVCYCHAKVDLETLAVGDV